MATLPGISGSGLRSIPTASYTRCHGAKEKKKLIVATTACLVKTKSEMRTCVHSIAGYRVQLRGPTKAISFTAPFDASPPVCPGRHGTCSLDKKASARVWPAASLFHLDPSVVLLGRYAAFIFLTLHRQTRPGMANGGCYPPFLGSSAIG